MTQPPDLAEVLAAAMREHWTCDCGDRAEDLDEQFAHVACEAAQAWREACTITTAEQLAPLAMPGVAVRASDGYFWEFRDRWYCLDESQELKIGPNDLPAQLIWHPGWAR